MATLEEGTNLVQSIITDRAQLAETQLTTVNSLITQTRDAIAAAIAAYQAVGWSVPVDGVNSSFSGTAGETAPEVPADESLGVDCTFNPVTGETAPEVPTEDTVAIGDAEWDQDFARAQGLQDRAKVKNLWMATERAAMLGHDEWDETQSILTAEAEDKGDEEESKNAIASAVEQAKAAREDILSLVRLRLERYDLVYKVNTDQENARVQFERLCLQTVVDVVNLRLKRYGLVYKVNTDEESVRIQYERLSLDKVLEPEKGRVASELDLLEKSLRNANAELVDLAQVQAQLTNGLFSTSDVGLGWSLQSSENVTI